jgi:predicted dehydrogenase
MRFWGEWEWIKRVADEGRYGQIKSATFRRVGPTPEGWFRNGKLSGGALLDLHVHDTDFVYHLFGMPKAVFSRGYAGETGEIDHVVTQYLYDRTPIVTAEGAWGMAPGSGFHMKLTVNFERATADFDFDRDPPLAVYAEGKQQAVETPKHNGYLGEISYFLECVRTKTKPTRVTAEDALNGLRIIEAEKRSVASGKVEAV